MTIEYKFYESQLPVCVSLSTLKKEKAIQIDFGQNYNFFDFIAIKRRRYHSSNPIMNNLSHKFKST